MRVAVAGSSGFIGQSLLPSLRRSGHEVVRLVRHDTVQRGTARFDPARGLVDLDALTADGPIDAFVNLAGAGIGDKRWTEARKRELYDSHVQSAATVAKAAAALEPRPSVLVSVGAMGIYGHDNATARSAGAPAPTLLTEDAPVGSDLAARIVAAKEAATAPASEAGVRVVLPRLSLVMGPGGTLARRLVPLARAGLLGPLAGGDAAWSVVSLDDVVAAMEFFLDDPATTGPYNIAAAVTTNKAFTKALGTALRRPTVLPVPRFGISLVLGELAKDVLASFALDSSRLTEAGFSFQDEDVDTIARALI